MSSIIITMIAIWFAFAWWFERTERKELRILLDIAKKKWFEVVEDKWKNRQLFERSIKLLKKDKWDNTNNK